MVQDRLFAANKAVDLLTRGFARSVPVPGSRVGCQSGAKKLEMLLVRTIDQQLHARIGQRIWSGALPLQV
jgi:hypothetical protein